MPSILAAGQAFDDGVVIRVHEVHQRQTPRTSAYIAAWINDPMEPGTPPIIRPVRHQIADVQDDPVVDQRNVDPIPGPRLNL
jgi:hypothetical protein